MKNKSPSKALPKREARYLTILRQMVKDCRCQPGAERGCALCAPPRKILKLPYYNTFSGALS